MQEVFKVTSKEIHNIFLALLSLLIVFLSSFFSPLVFFLSIILLVLFFALSKSLDFGFFIILILIIAGQFFRFPLSIGGGLMISDVFIPIYLIFWFLKKITKREPFRKSFLGKSFLFFTIIAFLSLVFGLRFLESGSEFFLSFFYLIRFIEYALLYFLVLDTVDTNKKKFFYIKALLVSGFIVAILGFIQFVFYPDFGEMALKGWDPHIGRLLSTWFDPNYCAGFFGFLILIALGIYSESKEKKQKKLLLVFMGTLAIALFLTYSRSGYLAFFLPLFLFGILKLRKLIILGLILILLLLGFSERAQQRVGEFYHTVISVTADPTESIDPTASQRIMSWLSAGEIILNHPIIGIGFNTYRYYSLREGITSDLQTHSSGGSDSSFLNVFVMTGFLGGAVFVYLLIKIFISSLRSFLNKKNNSLDRGLSLGFIFAFLSIFIHSFFVNSLFFPFIMIYIWMFLGLIERNNLKSIS